MVRYWPANESGRRAYDIARTRGQLVCAERHGDVVRVVLRVPALRATRVRQRATARPWLVPAAVIAGAVVALGTLVVLVVAWVLEHLAVILGAGVVVLLGVAVLARIAGVGGRDDHPCNR